MNRIRVLLADDHTLVRAGIQSLLEKVPEVEIVAEASDGLEALHMMKERHPDVALVNISMPGMNGLETALRAAKEHPRIRIIIFSAHADDEYVRRALQVGAAGYLVKTATRDELIMAINAVARGDTWLSPVVSKTVMALARGESGATERAAGEDPLDLLTGRQREVLQLIAEGHSTKEIAQRLNLSAKTVETYRAQLMERLGVRGIPALVRSAIRLGIVRPEA